MRILISAFKKDAARARSLADELRVLKCDVVVVRPDSRVWVRFLQMFSKATFFRSIQVRLFEIRIRLCADMLLGAVSQYKPEIFLSIGGEYLRPETVRKISGMDGAKAICWVTDEAATLETGDPMRWFNFSAYSHLFAVDKLWAQSLQLFPNIKSYLPYAGNISVYFPQQKKEKSIDVLFYGDMFPDHPHTVTGLGRLAILGELSRAGIRAKALVPGFSKIKYRAPNLLGINLLDRRFTDVDKNTYFNRAKIIVYMNTMLLKTDYDEELYNMALSGAFIITDTKINSRELFDGELVTFSHVRELPSLIKRWKMNDSGRARVSGALCRIARERHTYNARAQTLLDMVGAEKL